ncbi:hypothetical protein V6N13_053380 [Hibiscus sabdariffa]
MGVESWMVRRLLVEDVSWVLRWSGWLWGEGLKVEHVAVGRGQRHAKRVCCCWKSAGKGQQVGTIGGGNSREAETLGQHI